MRQRFGIGPAALHQDLWTDRARHLLQIARIFFPVLVLLDDAVVFVTAFRAH